MPFCAPLRRPYTWHARIIPGNDGLYEGPRDGSNAGLPAQGVMVHDDRGEGWATVAWLPDDPRTWWVGRYPFPPHTTYPALLGCAEVAFAADWRDRRCDLFLVETPARWAELAIGPKWPGPTACVLNWDARDSLRLWLGLVYGVHCETERLERLICTVLGGEGSRLRVRVKSGD